MNAKKEKKKIERKKCVSAQLTYVRWTDIFGDRKTEYNWKFRSLLKII